MKLMAIIKMMKSVQCQPMNKLEEVEAVYRDVFGYYWDAVGYFSLFCAYFAVSARALSF